MLSIKMIYDCRIQTSPSPDGSSARLLAQGLECSASTLEFRLHCSPYGSSSSDAFRPLLSCDHSSYFSSCYHSGLVSLAVASTWYMMMFRFIGHKAWFVILFNSPFLLPPLSAHCKSNQPPRYSVIDVNNSLGVTTVSGKHPAGLPAAEV